jgi:hypothetical protein
MIILFSNRPCMQQGCGVLLFWEGEDGRLVLGDLTDRTSRAGVNIEQKTWTWTGGAILVDASCRGRRCLGGERDWNPGMVDRGRGESDVQDIRGGGKNREGGIGCRRGFTVAEKRKTRGGKKQYTRRVYRGAREDRLAMVCK